MDSLLGSLLADFGGAGKVAPGFPSTSKEQPLSIKQCIYRTEILVIWMNPSMKCLTFSSFPFYCGKTSHTINSISCATQNIEFIVCEVFTSNYP